MRPINENGLMAYGFTCPYSRWVNGNLGLWIQYSIKNQGWEIYRGSTLLKEGMHTLEEIQNILDSLSRSR